MMLQKITTSEPDAQQLEVALASIRTAILLEKNIIYRLPLRKFLLKILLR